MRPRSGMQPSISNNGRTKEMTTNLTRLRRGSVRDWSVWAAIYDDFATKWEGINFAFPRRGGSRAAGANRIGTTWAVTRDSQARHCPHENAMPWSWKWESDGKFTYSDSEQETNWSCTAENQLRKDEISEEDNLFRHLAAAAPRLKIDIGGGWKNAEEKVQSSSTSAFFWTPKNKFKTMSVHIWILTAFFGMPVPPPMESFLPSNDVRSSCSLPPLEKIRLCFCLLPHWNFIKWSGAGAYRSLQTLTFLVSIALRRTNDGVYS